MAGRRSSRTASSGDRQVIAHDSLDWSFAAEMAEYLPFARDPAHFAQSVSFEVDECGLELSIMRGAD